jgi:ABC-type multidrug transport system fused ATPase/permease subunit
MEMPSLYLFLDPYLIWFYRLTGQPGWNFIIGTSVVAVLALMVGELTSFLASLLVRRHFTQVAGEAKKYQDLSMEALKAGNRPAYEAANKLANEAFGKAFFMQITLGASFLWPIFFVLAWMSYRFADLEFPVPYLHFSLGYIAVFLFLLVAAYFVFKPLKCRIPYFRRIQAMLAASSRAAKEMKSFADLLAPGAEGKR